MIAVTDYPTYEHNLKALASTLRKNGTLGEVLLWQQLKKRQIEGYRFTRQKPIGRYIVDFFCKELRLVIEVDGGSHDIRGEEDRKRQKELEGMGLIVIRVSEKDVRYNIQGVLEGIRQKLLQIAQKEHS
ncbi:MAG: Uncharacterized protein XD94_0867 [Mesotoga prima]|uniref:DUF559 domain-containing protein n=1 Tax=Mesotoga prima TaxID=1184387 RepID=A0A124FYB4_9BACT|nr:MAG: Uncharacterized protein XD94_0867 [Mesotoga prima]